MKPLTQKQARVLSFIAMGYTDGQIAHVIGRAENTIGRHVVKILENLEANNRAHAAAMWAAGRVQVKDAA